MSELLDDGIRWLNAHANFVEAEARISERLNGADVSPVAFMALWKLYEIEDQWNFQSSLRGYLSLSKVSLSEILTRLEAKALIERQRPPHGEDQRERRVRLTAKGRALVDSVATND